ncbi:MAG: GspH/FimT family pseudopilin [Reinekea forsetii]|nr:GspH/FimT family pseudopilin [Reinekea forsetii]
MTLTQPTQKQPAQRQPTHPQIERRSQLQGFTLLELMVTVIILGIITAFAAPSFNNLMRDTRIDANTSKVRSALTYARSEAVNLSSTVTVCSSTDYQSCDGDENWASGWIVFLDLNGDGDFDDDSDANPCETNIDDCVLRVWDPLASGASLIETNDEDSVTFSEQGAVVAATAFSLDLTMPDCALGDRRTLSLNAIGRLQVSTGDCP